MTIIIITSKSSKSCNVILSNEQMLITCREEVDMEASWEEFNNGKRNIVMLTRAGRTGAADAFNGFNYQKVESSTAVANFAFNTFVDTLFGEARTKTIINVMIVISRILSDPQVQ